MQFNDQSSSIRSRRDGFTIVELLVSIAVLSALVVLLLPAVQRVRGAARSAQCKSRLSQLGKAHHAFHATHNEFPTNSFGTEQELLGFLDGASSASQVTLAGGNGTVSEAMECPDDFIDRSHKRFITSYLKNLGDMRAFQANGYIAANRAADITDGLSNTACMSEKLQFDYDDLGNPIHTDPKAVIHYVPSQWSNPSQLPRYISECLAADVYSPYRVISLGYIYTHVLPPNEKSCYNGPYDTASPSPMIVTPSSQHFDGAHVLLADGAVRPVSRHVDRKIWQALGTIRGSEVIGDY